MKIQFEKRLSLLDEKSQTIKNLSMQVEELKKAGCVVVFQETVIVVQSDKPHFYSGESMTINGSLEMDNGTLLSGILAFYFDDVYLESFSTNGSYSFDYIPDASYINVGLHVIEIRYSEIDYNLEGKNSVDIYLHRKVYIEIEEKRND